MNKNLELLVTQRTEALEKEKNRALQEIDLAGFVQKSFYKVDTSEIKDWDLHIAFKPMSGVSGDLYIVFITENHLDGIGIFDISGHGIASGLVTMLVKNIIEKEFKKGKKLPLNNVMEKINDRIIAEKGSIDRGRDHPCRESFPGRALRSTGAADKTWLYAAGFRGIPVRTDQTAGAGLRCPGPSGHGQAGASCRRAGAGKHCHKVRGIHPPSGRTGRTVQKAGKQKDPGRY